MSEVLMSTLRGTGSGEVSLQGDVSVNKLVKTEYLITDYDSFSEYKVRAPSGVTITRDEDVVSLTVGNSYSGNTVIFYVSKGGKERAFTVAVGSASVAKPTVVYPTEGSISSLTINAVASAPRTVPEGIGEFTKVQWRLARKDNDEIIVSPTLTSLPLERAEFASMPHSTGLTLMVRYENSVLGWGPWSDKRSFTTTEARINKPSLTLDQPSFDVNENPRFTATPFSTTPANADSHLSSTWRLLRLDEEGSHVAYYLENSLNNKNSLRMPDDILRTSSEYIMQVRFNGSEVGISEWSDGLRFSTATSFTPTELGTPWKGGIYAGRIRVDGVAKAIVMASNRDMASNTGLTLNSLALGDVNIPNTDSTNDCYANMQGYKASGLEKHPAPNYCNNFRGGGKTDWLLPSIDVCEIMGRNFKPTESDNNTAELLRPHKAPNSDKPYGDNGYNPNSVPVGQPYTAKNPPQTSLTEFKAGGSEAFPSNYIRLVSSSQVSIENFPEVDTSEGKVPNVGQYSWRVVTSDLSVAAGSKIGNRASQFVRPVRILPII